MKKVIEAITFASKKHLGQTRKSTGLPYITHPIIVSHLLMQYKGTSKNIETLMVAGILHDTLEDTDTNFQEISTKFSPEIAGLVLELTSDEIGIEKLGKNEYLKAKMAGMSSYALVIKLCDRLSNIMDNPTDKYKIDTIDLLKHLENSRVLTETHTSIMEAVKDEI